MRKVYITGVGFITSIGNDASTVTKNLRELRHGIVSYPPFQDESLPIKVAAPVTGFDLDSTDPEDWVLPEPYKLKREITRSMAPNVVYSWCAMQQAITDAGLADTEISNTNTGLYAASGGSPFLLGHYIERMRKYGVMRCQPLGIVASIAGTVNFNLVAHYRIQGTSTGFSSACASSGHAMGFAYDDIALGRQERMFVVGAEDGNYDSILPFAGMRALSIQTDPDLASRPFDINRDGFVGTGGATVLVLESEDEVARRGVTPYCEYAGWGQASDGHSVAMSHPEGRGLKQALEVTLRSAKIEPGEVDYINAHATSTPIGDISEARAIDAVFSQKGARPMVSSTKALTGHGLSLASAMEAGFCALAIREGFTPGSAHISEIDPECAGLNIIQETLPTGPKIVVSPSSGFGGANVCLVFRKVD